MSFIYRLSTCIVLLFALFCTLLPQTWAAAKQYDLAYAWDTDLQSILDYREQLEEVLEDEIASQLKIVKKDKKYGIIYDCNASSLDIVKIIALQGTTLQEAGLNQALTVEDNSYHELYNVSYGYGPNLDAMIKNFQQVYECLGRSVGKDLYIERDDKGKYIMVYQRHGDRLSSLVVARRHARLLKKKGIRTTVAKEGNYPVVYGESSYLHNEEELEDKKAVAVQKPAATDNVVLSPGSRDKAVQKAKPVKPQASSFITLRNDNYKVAVNAAPPKKTPRASQASSTTKKYSNTQIRHAANTSIEQRIESYIKKQRERGGLRSDEKTGWMVYDLETDSCLVDINADQSFQAASMIKPFVALAFFHKVKAKQLKYGPKSRRNLEAMIQRSNNASTNWVMKQVGGPAACQQILSRYYKDLFKRVQIVEYIPPGGRTYRNKAMPSDYVRFLRALWNRQLPYSNEIRRLMSLPGRDRLYYGTPIPKGTLVYNKTGTTAHLCGDMGILVPKTRGSKRYPYAIVGIIERSSRPSNYRKWMQTRGGVIRKVSTLVYDELKKEHNLK